MPFHRTIVVGVAACAAAFAAWPRDLAPPAADEASLAAALNSADVGARRRAAQALIGMGRAVSDATLRRLVLALGDDDLVVRGSAGATLVVCGPRVVGDVSRVLSAEAVRGRRAAISVLTRLDPPPVAASDALAAAFRDSDPLVRRGAGEALSRLGNVGVLALRRALRDDRREVRLEALECLAAAGVDDEAIADDVAELLADTDDGLADTAASALAGFGPTGHRALTAALDSDFPAVRGRAAAMLGRIAPTVTADRFDTVAALRRLLADGAAEVRLAAAEGLNHIGRPATFAASELLRAQDDADPRVRAAATRALLTMIRANQPAGDASPASDCQ